MGGCSSFNFYVCFGFVFHLEGKKKSKEAMTYGVFKEDEFHIVTEGDVLDGLDVV